MESTKNSVLRIYRFAGLTPEEIGANPDTNDAFLLERKQFDEAGNQILKEEYDSEGTISEKYTWEYNEKGMVVRHQHYFGEELSEEERFVYENDKLVREEKIFADGSVSVTHNTYDADGNLVAKKTVNEDGETEASEILSYEEDRLVSHSKYGEENELVEEYSAQYEKEGDAWVIREELSRDIPNDTVFRTVHQGTSSVVYDANGSRYSSHKKVFNEKGLLIENHYSTLQRDFSAFYKYDEQGRLIEEERVTGNSVSFRAFSYYDEEGKLKMLHVTEASAGTFTDLFLTENQAS